MNEANYRDYLKKLDQASSTISTRLSALRRIERAENVDLDVEFDRDHLGSLLNKYAYSIEDFRSGRPNPTAISIEPDRLYQYLAFNRNQIASYRNFRATAADIPAVRESETDEQEFIVEEEGRTFALERDLQDALRKNLAQLGEELAVADGGSEAKVEAGFIDILAKDAEGNWVVIELKAGTAQPASVVQLLAYMGSVAHERGGSVRGLLVAADFHPRVNLAIRAVPNITLKRYRFNFSFE